MAREQATFHFLRMHAARAPETSFRILSADDAERYRRLRLESLKESPEAFAVTHAEEVVKALKDWRAALDLPESFVFGAFSSSGELVGVAGCRRESTAKTRHKATIWGMYVAPAFRGRAIGRDLLNGALAHARLWADLEQVNLSLVVGNEVARILYMNAGFRSYGIEPRAGRDDGRYYDLECFSLDFRVCSGST